MSTPKPRFFLGKPKPSTTSSSSLNRSSTPAFSSARATPGASGGQGGGGGSKPPPPAADAPIALDGDTRLAEYSSPEDVCPVCKNDRYLNPKLRLMVSKCYHKMCESCLDRLFSLGPEPCPVCGQTIRKNQFQPQIFQNLEVQKEVAVRRRMAKIFNKAPEDFPTPSAYNDYLETYESLTFSLIHSIGSDLAATEAKIRAYELANRQSIEDNEERLAREKDEFEQRERGEREWREMERRRAVEEVQREEREREEERRRVMAELEKGDLDPDEILAQSLLRTAGSSSSAPTTTAAGAPTTAGGRKRSSARDTHSPSVGPGGAASAEEDRAFAKMQFLSSLASSRSANASSTSSPSLPPLDPLSDYSPTPLGFTAFTPLLTLPRGFSPASFAREVGSLVKERERDTTGGFRAEEVWRKAVGEAVGGLWEVPLGWEGAAGGAGGGGAAMEVDVAA
ncbi:hypothetical protein JCM6882_009414 [Rhodosporidiobolus microsporus]